MMGLQGKGRLTIEKIDCFQTYYGKAIRGNKGDMSKMKSETQALLHHSSDLPEDIKHPKDLTAGSRPKIGKMRTSTRKVRFRQDCPRQCVMF